MQTEFEKDPKIQRALKVSTYVELALYPDSGGENYAKRSKMTHRFKLL